MIYHRYPLRSLIWDYCRAGIGLAFALVPLILGKPGLFFFVLLGTVGTLFFLYGLRTLALQFTAYELRPDGIVCHGPRRRFFAWDEMAGVRLRYYSTQKDKSRRDLDSGWLELRITGPSGKLKIDSEVEGFATILQAVARAVDRRRLPLDEMTQENLQAFDSTDVGPPPGGTASHGDGSG